jgi:uncharacterized protein with HEPN domain
MPSERDEAALLAIRENVLLAEAFTHGLDEAAFSKDQKTFYAVTRCLEIISEASRSLSEDVKARHASIPWNQIAGAGNVYRHNYDDILASFVWTTVTRSLPALLTAVDAEFDTEP